MNGPRATANSAGSRACVVILLASAVVSFSEQRAAAEDGGAITNGVYTFIGGTVAGTASLPFLFADLAYAVQGEWLPPGWAVTQIVIGGGIDAIVAGWGMSVYAHQCGRTISGCGGVLALTIATTVLSAGFIAHGAVSLNLYTPEQTTKASGGTGLGSRSAYIRWLPDIVVTRDHKTYVVFSGAF
jgi:hypothetical protein